MTFMFRPAKRQDVSLLIGLAGASGSGKSFTAMRLATGLAAGRPWCVIDTEAGRAKHYADLFQFSHGDLEAPFTPAAYADAIAAADAEKYAVIVVDSMSHEHSGVGGLLDIQEAEFKRMGSRDAAKMASWIVPKGEHRRMVSRLLQVRAHLILCFRASEKIEMVRGQDGKMEVRKKQTLTGVEGWVPDCEKTLPYELTASFLLMPARPGVPIPIKLQEQHRPFFPLDQPITEKSGEALAQWARGGESHQPAMSSVRSAPSTDSGLHSVAGGGASGSTTPTDGRSDIIGKIKRAADRQAIPPHVRTTLAKQCIGNASMQDADIAALQDLLTAVEKWRPAK